MPQIQECSADASPLFLLHLLIFFHSLFSFYIIPFVPSPCALFASLFCTASVHLFICYPALLPPEQPFLTVFLHTQVKQPSENHGISDDSTSLVQKKKKDNLARDCLIFQHMKKKLEMTIQKLKRNILIEQYNISLLYFLLIVI